MTTTTDTRLPAYDDGSLAMTATADAPGDTYTRQQIQTRLDALTEATRRLSEAVANGARPPSSAAARLIVKRFGLTSEQRREAAIDVAVDDIEEIIRELRGVKL